MNAIDKRRAAELDALAENEAGREKTANFSIGLTERQEENYVEHIIGKAFQKIIKEALRNGGLDDSAVDQRARDLRGDIEGAYQRRLRAGRAARLRSVKGGLARVGRYRVRPEKVQAAVADARKSGLSLTSARAHVSRTMKISMSKVKANTQTTKKRRRR